jgi:alkylmercury lyase
VLRESAASESVAAGEEVLTMEPSDPSRLAADMSDLVRRTPGVKEACALTRPIIGLLARGEPVTMDALSMSTGVPAGRLRTVLQQSPYAEWTADGRLEGFGLTLRPTPHSLRIGEAVLYVWTAADAFVSAVMLARPIRISSSCHVTGVPIWVDVSSEGVGEVEPPTAVVTALARPQAHRTLSWLAASRQLFFRSPQAASTWTEKRPDYMVLGMREAFEYAKHLAAAL